MKLPLKNKVLLSLLSSVLMTGCISALQAEPVDFAHEVAPIIKEYCIDCHLGEKKKGGFSMNTRADILEGSENGDVLELKQNIGSYFIELLETDDADLRMPPKGLRVTKKQLEILTRWIEEGVGWEEGFSFGEGAWEPPLKPRKVKLPEVTSENRNHSIDRLIDSYWTKNKIKPPGEISDAEFMRRLYFDVIGLLPKPDELKSFLDAPESSQKKRLALIDELLDRDIDYAEHWLTFWNDLLRNDYAGTGFIDGGRKQITDWLYRSLVDNKKYDQFVRELIAPTAASEGFIRGIKWRGKVNASQTTEIQFSQNISQVFLGINMKCASCHDSFVDRWKLDEAYNLGAIFATAPLEIHRCDKSTGKMAKAAWIFPELGEVDPKATQPERLNQLAGLMTHPENGRFTRTMVNRIWHRFMGRGIVHPVDAMHTKPWSEDLLDWLAGDFTASDYDLKQLIRTIVTSETYQSQVAKTPTGAEAEPNRYVFAGPIARRMTAEQFIDAIWTITDGAPAKPVAQILRAKLNPEKIAGSPVEGKWIWSKGEGAPPAKERRVFRKQFELKEKPALAQVVVNADNSYLIYVNGKKIGSDENWQTVESFPLDGVLRKGKNEILFVVTNGGNGPNAAGAFFDSIVRFRGADGKYDSSRDLRISTDESWEWSALVPNAKGKYGKPVKDWATAELVKNIPWIAKTSPKVQEILALAMSDSGKSIPVRVSLVKSDLLMRAMGRPNREQVVTVRPEELSTLQALNLANGDALAGILSRGAAKLLKSRDGVETPGKLIDWMFQYTLSREPGADERAILTEMLQPKMEQKQVEDLLWTVFMLPEFQLIQ